MIEMSKIRQKTFKVNYKQIDIKKKVESIVASFKHDLRVRELDSEVKISDKLKRNMILIDEERLSIVIYNLVSNAVKFTSGGLIKVSVKILD